VLFPLITCLTHLIFNMLTTLQRHNTENSKQIFPGKELIALPILLQENRRAERGNIKIAHRHMNMEIGTEGRTIPFLGIHKTKFLCRAYCTTYILTVSVIYRVYIVSNAHADSTYTNRHLNDSKHAVT
jgi:hypothetical protein